jgi:subtilase family serine protease
MLRSLTVAAAAAAVLLGVASATTAAPPTKTTLHGSAPAWARQGNFVRAADPAGPVGFRVYLGWNSGAEAFARSVSTPSSASYGKYISASEFRRRFAPSEQKVSAVRSWLKAQGFSIVYTPTNNHYVSAEGTVAQAEAAFGTPFGVYSVEGQTVQSPSSDVAIPNDLAADVTGVIGLDDSSAFVETFHVVDKNAPPSPGFRNAPPLSNFFGELTSPYTQPAGFGSPSAASWSTKGYTPQQVKGVYGITGPETGAGQTVAIIDAFASPTILQDVNQWSVNRGLPTMNASQFTQVVPPGIYNKPQGPQMDPQGWYGEETLDVEAVHGMAPGAKIVYVGAPNARRDLDAAMNYVVDRQLAGIVSNSYGYPTELLPPGWIIPLEDTFIQAAAEGIGVYFASGDGGDETSTFGFATPDWPAISPWVTAVGGTALGIGATNNRVLETGWGTSNYLCNSTSLVCTRAGWLYGSGGGTSRIFAKPAYQSGLSGSGRSIPDVGALGDPQTGLLIGQTQAFPAGSSYDEYRIGGTSASVQVFAGLMALADQRAGHRHGFANPAFYANPSSFYDVLSVKSAVARRNFNNGVDASAGTSDFLRTFDDYSGSPTQHTGPGWDNVTGLGTPAGIFSH